MKTVEVKFMMVINTLIIFKNNDEEHCEGMEAINIVQSVQYEK